MSHRLPDWRLPQGVTRSLWDYAHADHIAYDYDDHFADNRLFDFDAEVIDRHFTRPGRVVDLGAGTGRLLLPLVARGFQGVAVDLSRPMLEVAGEKAKLDGFSVQRVLGNLVELDFLRDGIADYCLLMFSTLGMIRGRQNRARVLGHARRILKPGGLLVCHVHNRWYNALDPQGRAWLVTNAIAARFRKDVEPGDKVYEYRGIPGMFIHVFTQSEFTAALGAAGFEIVELVRLDTHRHRSLPHAWFFGPLRANGWIAVCRKPTPLTASPLALGQPPPLF